MALPQPQTQNTSPAVSLLYRDSEGKRPHLLRRLNSQPRQVTKVCLGRLIERGDAGSQSTSYVRGTTLISPGVTSSRRGWGAQTPHCLWGSPTQKDVITLNEERFDFSLNLFPGFKQFHSLVVPQPNSCPWDVSARLMTKKCWRRPHQRHVTAVSKTRPVQSEADVACPERPDASCPGHFRTTANVGTEGRRCPWGAGAASGPLPP